MSENQRRSPSSYRSKAKGTPKLLVPAIVGALAVIVVIGLVMATGESGRAKAPISSGTATGSGERANAPNPESSSTNSATASMTVRQLADHINDKLMPTQKDRRVQEIWKDIYRDIRLERLFDASLTIRAINQDVFEGECKQAMAQLRQKLTEK